MKHKISLYWLLFTALLVALPSQAAEHVTYYVNDALGSPILAMDEQGAVVWQESYQPYGQRQVKPAAANYDEQFYTGKQEEPDIGLQYFGARWYDPEAGRFTSIDPVGVQEGEIHSFNRYAYANNNPYRFTDPNGESPLDVAFFAVDALAFGVAVASGNSQEIRGSGIDLAMSAIGLISPVPGTGQALKMAKAGRALDNLGDGAQIAKGVSTGAENVNAGAALNRKLSALEGAQQNAAITRELPDGRIRYYEAERAARNPGPTRGSSYVTEYNPANGNVRSWNEAYDQAGNVNRVHPKMINGQTVNSQHYPPTARELGM